MMNKIKGSAGTHSYSQAEKFSYCDFINQELTGDPDLPQLPMDPNSDDLFRVVSRGILLWYVYLTEYGFCCWYPDH